MLLIWVLLIVSLITTTQCETTEVEESLQANSTIPPILEATASKLVRYRSKAPPTYYRYKTQAVKRPRPRIKAHKGKHGPSTYIFADPTSYYKQQPEIYTSTQSYKPSYSYDEVHYEVSSEDTIPISSYEAQAMDLEFYGDSYSKKKAPQYEYTKPQKTYTAQRPHKMYAIPKETSHNSYGKYSVDDYKTQYASKPEVHYEVSYHEEPPKQDYGPPRQQMENYEQFPPYGAPPKDLHQPEHVSYREPENKFQPPASSYHPPHEQPLKEGPYPVYQKKLPNSGYEYNNHFAEPPTDIHITYSPSYDINPQPPKHRKPQNSYEAPSIENYDVPSNDYGPPGYNQETHGDYQAPSDSYQQPSGGHFAEPPRSYVPPVYHQDQLPLNKNHMPPGYDYPKTSYEVPIYDPIPFESTTSEHDYFPPNTREPHHEHVSETNNHIQHIPSERHAPNPSTTVTTTTTLAHEPIQEANNKVHRYTKHHHRPNHVHKQESTSKFPIVTEEVYSSEAPSSKYLDKILSTTSTLRTTRKRKRTKAPVTEKHNLDAPELKEAFELGYDQSEEPIAHSSNIKETVEPGRQDIENTNPVRTLTDFSPSQAWNPMRTRTRMRQHNLQRGQRTSENALNDLKNIEVVSIEKSRSHSYYAGTVPPRTRTLSSRADAVKMSTVPSTTFRAEDAIQPTRSLVIDKTYFKAKDDEEEFYDGTGELPKNHKLF